MNRQTALKSSDAFAETAASTIAAIGARIRELRLERSMTLQALAEATGLSPSLISVVERGRSSPSIGSLIVIAEALDVPMSELIAVRVRSEEDIVVRPESHEVIETARHVVRRLIREDRSRGVSVALNEYAPHTGSAERPITHEGFEYGYVLEGILTVEVDGVAHVLEEGDLIAYSSQRRHRIWNHGEARVRTLWFNFGRS